MTESYRGKLESSEIVRETFLTLPPTFICVNSIKPSCHRHHQICFCACLFFLSRSHCPFFTFSNYANNERTREQKVGEILYSVGFLVIRRTIFASFFSRVSLQVLFFSAPTPTTWLTKCNKITQISKPRSDLGALNLTAAPRRTKNLLQSFFYAVRLFGMKFPF